MDLTKKIIPVVIFFFAFVFNSCKNDLKLNAPYKEIPSIYAVLNPQDKIQMIRINKVFLGEGDANQMAKVSDSINYQPNELTVSLKHATGGTIFFRDSVIRANDGPFNTEQRVYVTSEKLKVSGEYVLTVKNNNTGNVFTAKASAIDSVDGRRNPAPFSEPYYPYPLGTSPSDPPYVDYSQANTTKVIYYKPIKQYTSDQAKDPKIYQMLIRFHFQDLANNGDIINRYVDYNFNNQYPQDVNTQNGFLSTGFKGKDVFNALGVSLSRMNLSNDIRGRKMYKVQFFVYASSQEYLDYLQFAAPSLNISQSKPLYSNFDNRSAIGIFTFRSRCSVMKEMSSVFINEFSGNSNTCQYKFLTVDDQYRGCR